jgi:hypothetical protein
MSHRALATVLVVVSAMLALGCSDDSTPPAAPYCGNGSCDWNENVLTCPGDCGTCGNGVCDPGESVATCAYDCDPCSGGRCLKSATFIVVQANWYQLAPAVIPPIAGATVAFDAPDGTRSEAVSGADGKVTFDGIDWSLGTAAVTAFAPAHALYSAVDLDEAGMAQSHLIDGAVPLLLSDEKAPHVDSVHIRGTVTGMTDSTHELAINVAKGTAGTSEWDGPGTGTFDVLVPAGQPFILQAREQSTQALPSGQGYDMPIYQVAHQSFDAVTADVDDAVIDFATSALATHTGGTVTVGLPLRAGSPVRAAWPYIFFCPRNTWWCVGWPTHIDVSADGNRFEGSFLWVDPEWVEEPRNYCTVKDGGFGGRTLSVANTAGYPESGSLGTLLDVPEWITPADPSSPHALHQPLEWQVFEDSIKDTMLNISRYNYTTTLWVVRAAPGKTTLRVPAAPSTVDEASLFGGAQHGVLQVGVFDWEHVDWTSIALSEPVLVGP